MIEQKKLFLRYLIGTFQNVEPVVVRRRVWRRRRRRRPAADYLQHRLDVSVEQEEERQLFPLQLLDQVPRAVEVRLAHRALALGDVDEPGVELGQLGDHVVAEVGEDAVEVVNGAKAADVRRCRRRLLSNFHLKLFDQCFEGLDNFLKHVFMVFSVFNGIHGTAKKV